LCFLCQNNQETLVKSHIREIVRPYRFCWRFGESDFPCLVMLWSCDQSKMEDGAGNFLWIPFVVVFC